MSMTILGIGTVSALGCGMASIKAGMEGSVEPLIKRREVKSGGDKMPPMPVYTASIEGLDRFISKSSLRRTDRFTQMAILASNLAIEDAEIALDDMTRVGIVFGSGYGPLETTFSFLDSLIDFGDKCASPTLFANSVHNSLVSHVSISLKIQGPSLTITCFAQTASSVFATAASWLARGNADFVLVGLGDEYCDVRGYATILSGSDNVKAIRPFCFDECTYIPGEGFVSFLVGGIPSDNSYCSLVDIKAGNRYARISQADEILFLGANGETRTGIYYRPFLKSKSKASAYSPLYGGMPVGVGFDMAIAAQSLKDGRLYPAPKPHAGPAENLVARSIPLAEDDSIKCISYDEKGDFSALTLARYAQ